MFSPAPSYHTSAFATITPEKYLEIQQEAEITCIFYTRNKKAPPGRCSGTLLLFTLGVGPPYLTCRNRWDGIRATSKRRQ